MRKWLKKSLAVGLALAVTAGFTACGGGLGSGSGNRGNGSSGGGGSAASAELAKEYVYKAAEFDFPQLVEPENGYVGIYCTAYRDGKVYLVAECNDGSKEEDSTEYNVIRMNPDGSDVQIIKLDTSKEGEGSEEEGSGESTPPEESASPEEGASEEAGSGDEAAADVSDDEVEPEWSRVWEYTGYGNFVISSEGKVFCIKNYNYEDYRDEANPIRENSLYICCWDEDGSRLWESELEGFQSDEEGAEWLYVNSIVTRKDGGLNLLVGGDNTYWMRVSSEGELSEREQLSEEIDQVMRNSQNMLERDDGTLLIIYSDENDWTKSYIAEYDVESDTLGEASQMPASFGWNGYNSLSAGVDSDLIFTMSDGVYVYNRGDEELTKKMDFVNSDLNIYDFRGMVELDKDSFVGIFNENNGEVMKGAVFTYRDPADIPDKSVIVLAGNWVDSDLRQRVVEYNRASDVYRIVLREYDIYNSYDDSEAGITKLNNDIVTGNMPDILITSGLPVENYIAKGLLADIGKLIEQDPELSQTEFLQNVFDAYSVDGTLYYVVPSFNVITMIAKTSLVGDRTTWTMEDMKQAVAAMGEDAQCIGELTRSSFMSTAMRFCGNDFIDVQTGKCAFNTENFINMMEYAKTLPEEIDWDSLYSQGNYWETQELQYRENRTLLMQMYIDRISDLNYSLNGSFDEPVSFVGFPTESGKGSYISENSSYVISAKSANMDGAWDFIRYYLTEDYQRELEWGLSVNREVFMERAQEATKKPTYIDEDGNEVEQEQTFWINEESIPLEPLSQEQVDQVVEFILSVDRAYYYNEDVFNIIDEEMGAFYSGQKSAQDTANVIQSRAQIFVDEHR